MSPRPEAAVVAAYSHTAAHWQAGPERIYDHLSDALVARSPVPLRGATVLDVGAGTGAATRAAVRAGAATVIAVDAAVGMLAFGAATRPPALAADARALALRAGAVDAAIAAFSLNHLADPQVALRELARVVRPGGAIVAGAYADDDHHPAKAAVEQALRVVGWQPPPWYGWLREQATAAMARPERVAALAAAAPLDEVMVEAVRVPLPGLTPAELVAWRLGMAQHAPFVATLSAAGRRQVESDALRRLGADPAPLVRSVIVLAARSAHDPRDPAFERAGVRTG